MITSGPDGNIWFTEGEGNRIGGITPGVVRKPCPVKVTLHTPTPTKIGSRVFTDRISTKKSSCVLRKPVVRVAWLDPSTPDAKKPVFDTKITKRGEIRVITKGHRDLLVTLIVRAKPKPGMADTWKPDTWRKPWLLR